MPLLGAAIVGCSLGPTHGSYLSAGSMVLYDMFAFLEDVGARSRTVVGRSAGPMAGWSLEDMNCDSAQWYPRFLTTFSVSILSKFCVHLLIIAPVATGVFVGEVHSLDVSCFLHLSVHRFPGMWQFCPIHA